MPLGMTIDELVQRIDPLSYWSFHSICQISDNAGCSCTEKSIGFVSISNGLCRIDVCNKHAKELAFTIMTRSHDYHAPQGSVPHLAATIDIRSFFEYTGKCEITRSNMQVCGGEAVGCFATLDGKQVKCCHVCTCKILSTLSREQPSLWLDPSARTKHHIIKMLEKWSTYERIIRLAPPLC